MSMQRSLYVSAFAPVFSGGRALRTYTCVRALAMLGPVDLAYVAHEGDGPSPEYQAIPGIEFHEIRSSRGLARGAVYLSERMRGVPDLCSRGTSPELIEVAERLAEERGRGRVVAGDTCSATGLMRLAGARPVIYNAHNIESEYIRGLPGPRELGRLAMRRYESRLLSVADESWMVSRTDMRSAWGMVPRARLRYAPNVVDVTAIRPRDRPAGQGSKLLMVGDFSYQPNLTGLVFLVGSVLPRVWETMPEVTLTLVGRGLEDWEAPDARIRVAGFVPILDPYYADADGAVVPLTEGAGTPLKFVEAMAYGMPIVATPLAAKGLEVESGVQYREGHDARTFADGVLAIFRQESEDAGLGARARLRAESEYSIESLAERLAGEPESSEGVRAARPAHPVVRSPGAHTSARRRVTASARWVAHAAGAGAGRRYPFVLCYHGVGAIAGASDPSSIFVSSELFRSHLDLISEQGYELLSLGELWARTRDDPGLQARGCITFDDGLVKTVREGIPMLLERGISCSMFVPTGLMGRRHPDLQGEMIVSPEEVRELAQAGVEIGAHSVDHVRLNLLNYADALDQMRRSRAELEDLLGAPITSMAYPFGAFDERSMRAAQEAGYELACGCSGPGPWRALCLPREPVFASATPLRLRLKMAGLYGPAYALVSERSPLGRLRPRG
jgi:peptidoglycan/xylan/chitin deacetylase (PgdA/CDA1 family)/glycosyltransferase involved in cell wall biosynthesis